MANLRINKENVEHVRNLKAQIKLLTEEVCLFEDAWKAQLEEEGVTEKLFDNGKQRVGWDVTVQNRFNQSKFGKDYPELLAQYKEPKECKSFKY